MVAPSTMRSTAIISCRPLATNTAPQVVSPAGMVTAAAFWMARTMAISRYTSAVKVTQSMMISGGNSILLLRPVTLRKTHSVMRTSAERS